MKTISIVINARLGSTRCPRKLVRPFAETTLIEIALDKLNAMDFFDHRFLAVAEEPLKEYVGRYENIELLERSPESVKPGFQSMRIIYEHYLRIPSTHIFWMNPCHPLLSIETVRKAHDYVMSTDYNSYTAAYSFRDWVFDESGLCVTACDAKMISTAHRSEYFKMAHSFHVYTKEYFAKTGMIWSMTPGDPELIKIGKEEAIDVDTVQDFEVAEILYRRRKRMDRADKRD